MSQVDGEDVSRQTASSVLAKIKGPNGSSVVLGMRNARTGEIFTVSLIRGNSTRSMLTRMRVNQKQWPDPKLYDETSILRMGLKNGLRQLCIFLIENRLWNAVVILSVFMSVATLPFDDPFEGDTFELVNGYSVRLQLIDRINVVLSLIFIFDVVIKIIAMGLITGPNAFLRDGFNRLDFVMAIFGLIDSFSSSGQGGMNAIRSIRALRPLKAINRFENLKTFITLIFVAQEKLQNAVFVVLFVTFLFAIVSIQLFRGVLRQKCFHFDHGDILGKNQRGCSTFFQNCPAEYICLEIGANIEGRHNMNSDNFVNAVLVNVQILTLANWCEAMYAYMTAYHPAAAAFFVLQIFFLPLYCAQIFIAILGIEIEPLQDFHLQVCFKLGAALFFTSIF